MACSTTAPPPTAMERRSSACPTAENRKPGVGWCQVQEIPVLVGVWLVSMRIYFHMAFGRPGGYQAVPGVFISQVYGPFLLQVSERMGSQSPSQEPRCSCGFVWSGTLPPRPPRPLTWLPQKRLGVLLSWRGICKFPRGDRLKNGSEDHTGQRLPSRPKFPRPEHPCLSKVGLV